MMTTLFDLVKQASTQVDRLGVIRSPSDVMNHAVAELGECALEIAIDQGTSYKIQGEDGIVGEAFDVIACMLDMIHTVNPDLTEQQLVAYGVAKMEKWVRKESQHVDQRLNDIMQVMQRTEPK